MVEKKEVKESKSTDLIEKANLAALRQEEANKELAKLLDRQEAMIVEKTLGGSADAGSQEVVEKTKEEIKIENARAFLKGTGYEDTLFPVEKK